MKKFSLFGSIFLAIMITSCYGAPKNCYTCRYAEHLNIEPFLVYYNLTLPYTPQCIHDTMTSVDTNKGEMCFYALLLDLNGNTLAAWRGVTPEESSPFPDSVDAWKKEKHVFIQRNCMHDLCNDVNSFAVTAKALPGLIIGVLLVSFWQMTKH